MSQDRGLTPAEKQSILARVVNRRPMIDLPMFHRVRITKGVFAAIMARAAARRELERRQQQHEAGEAGTLNLVGELLKPAYLCIAFLLLTFTLAARLEAQPYRLPPPGCHGVAQQGPQGTQPTGGMFNASRHARLDHWPHPGTLPYGIGGLGRFIFGGKYRARNYPGDVWVPAPQGGTLR